MKKQRKHYTPEEKVAILRRHLVEGVPISDLCDERGLQPTVFYRWQKEFFENGAAAFQQRSRNNHQPEAATTISLNRNESRIWKRRSRRRMKCWPNLWRSMWP
jgi:transposase-like protein